VRKLKELRTAAGLTQSSLSSRSGVWQSTISNIERGRTSPTVTTLHRLALALDVTMDVLGQDEADSVILRGTNARGEHNGYAKLTEADIHKIRAMRRAGALQREIAALFGVSQSLISDILAGKRWGWLQEETA